MGGNSGSGAQGQGQAGDQQLLQEAQAMWAQVFPLMQQLAPELLNTVQGKFTPLTEAARAPVIGQTQQDIRTMQNQAGGTANPNALYQDIAMTGQQQAGIAGDNMLSSALSGLQQLISGGMNFTEGATGTAAGQLNQLGEYQQNTYDAEQQAFWKGLLGAAGAAFGGAPGAAAGSAAGGMFGGGTATPGNIPGPNMAGLPTQGALIPPTLGVPGMGSASNAATQASGVPTAATQAGGSLPASANSAASNQMPDYYSMMGF